MSLARFTNKTGAALLALVFGASWHGLSGRTLEFDTGEVTQPGITAAGGERSLIFNLLGHLFEVPVSGGAAKQLTFGPYYDCDPAISPDGKSVAFISNRDGGDDGNLYLLNLASGKVSRLTHEFQAGLAAWSPDGKTVAYVAGLRREDYPADRVPGFGGGDAGYLKEVPAAGGTASSRRRERR